MFFGGTDVSIKAKVKAINVATTIVKEAKPKVKKVKLPMAWSTPDLGLMPCAGCPLTNCKKVEAGYGDIKTCKILIIGDYPNWEEKSSGQAFTNWAWQWFREVLNMPSSEIAFTNVIKCPFDIRTDDPKYKETLTKAATTCAINHLSKELLTTSAEYILVCGATAIQYVLGLKSITLARGKLYTIKGKKIIATFSPNYIYKFRASNNNPRM